jgi:hypothetical protein
MYINNGLQSSPVGVWQRLNIVGQKRATEPAKALKQRSKTITMC